MTTKVTLDVVDPDVLNRANHTGSQAISTVTGLQTALDGKAPSTGIAISSVTNLQTTLDSKVTATFAQSTYVPTTTGVSNIDSISGVNGRYTRLGTHVHVWGSITVDTTAAASTSFRMSLPVASALGSTNNCRGGFSTVSSQAAGMVSGDTTNNEALFTFTAIGTGAVTYSFWFDYIIA